MFDPIAYFASFSLDRMYVDQVMRQPDTSKQQVCYGTGFSSHSHVPPGKYVFACEWAMICKRRFPCYLWGLQMESQIKLPWWQEIKSLAFIIGRHHMQVSYLAWLLIHFLLTFYFIHCQVLVSGILDRLISNELSFVSFMIGLVVMRKCSCHEHQQCLMTQWVTPYCLPINPFHFPVSILVRECMTKRIMVNSQSIIEWWGWVMDSNQIDVFFHLNNDRYIFR